MSATTKAVARPTARRPAGGQVRASSQTGAGALQLASSLTSLRGVGPRRAEQLRAAGFSTVEDLLVGVLPVRCEDRRHRQSIAALPSVGTVTVCGEIRELRRVFTRRRGLTLLRGRVVDASGELPVVWFNRPYLLQQVREGLAYRLHGDLRAVGGGRELLNPSLEPLVDAGGDDGGPIVPIYPAIAELPPAVLRALLRTALAGLAPGTCPDPLPPELLARHDLPSREQALRCLHDPREEPGGPPIEAQWQAARARLVYGELFSLQLELALARQELRREPKPHRYRVDDEVRAVARQILPFRLTAAQRRVVAEIVADLRQPAPMLRLLQGDVGAGKTIVMAMAMLVGLESGLQVAVLAPTELLAEQQFTALSRLFADRHRGELVTASRQSTAHADEEALADLARPRGAGGVAWVVGTHALLEPRVRFANLGLVVIDEQHRFGVAQRQRLQAKGARPDVLVMTATPIPRSLALALYGDLDLSLLDELPPGRQPVVTEMMARAERSRAWDELRATLAAGGQAYVVVPRIDESEEEPAAGRSLAAVAAELARELPGVPIAVVHGRQESDERRRAMAAFAAGTARVLLATTVIEVGVDVAAASLIVIDGAERFGLAQLHQLRGRVGRGQAAARCLALVDDPTPEAEARMASFVAATDGFALAEMDLALRGPGELLGTRQSGAPLLGLARLPADQPWLERAREDARAWVDHPALGALRQTLAPQVARRLARIQGG